MAMGGFRFFFAIAALFAVCVSSSVGCTATSDSDLDEASELNEPVLDQLHAVCPAGYQDRAPRVGLNTGFTVAGQRREFYLLKPPSTFVGPRPLFVAFNGTSENGTKFVRRAKLADFAAKGFLVVAPSSAGNGSFWPIWDAMRRPGQESLPNPDLELFDTLLACTSSHFSVDTKRIFVGGHSAGGIFANKVLRARSNVVAGGIVGSGVFSLTQSGSETPLRDMFVLVTWGGDNDIYRGSTPDGTTVSEFNFVEQASLASKYYESQAKVDQVRCRGNDLGHAWLPLNAWFAAAMIGHPKGGPAAPLPPVPSTAPVVCRSDAYVLPPLPDIACGTSTRAGCQATCQLMADCAAENRTVGPVMKSELATFGFAGTSCGGCVTRCEQNATGTANASVLACFQAAQATAQCGAGIEGSFPFMGAVDKCCKGRTDSSYCVDMCRTINKNDSASAFFPVCKTIAPLDGESAESVE